MNKLRYVLFVFVIGYFACDDFEPIEGVASFIDGSVVTVSINPFSVAAVGEVLHLGDGIVDHGHVWTSDANEIPTVEITTKSSRGPLSAIGSFSDQLDQQLFIVNQEYRIRSYAIDVHNRVVYGELKTFTRSITFSQSDYPQYIGADVAYETADGDFILAGPQSASGNAFVIKVDQFGEQIFDFNECLDCFTINDRLLQMMDVGGVLLLGTSGLGGAFGSVHLWHFDHDSGDLIKGEYRGATGTESGAMVLYNQDIFVSGSVNYSSSYFPYKADDMLFLKVIPGFGLSVDSTYIDLPKYERGITLTALEDGDFLLVGSQSSDGFSDPTLFIVKVDRFGNVFNTSLLPYRINAGQKILEIAKISSSPETYRIFGLTEENEVFTVDVDDNGEEQIGTYRTINPEATNITDFIINDDLSLVIAGEKNSKAYAAGIASDLSSITWNTENDNFEDGVFFGISETSDGGLLGVGITNAPSMLLVKMSAEGEVFN